MKFHKSIKRMRKILTSIITA